MEIPDELRCLFSAQIEEQNGTYQIEVPTEELQLGKIQEQGTYRVAILSTPSQPETSDTPPDAAKERSAPAPPVEEGDQQDVEIEDIGEQGDGITRVKRGFVVIVPETKQGERVTIEITDVRENVAFAEVVDREGYFN
jgi:predicted RNA-binding protein with TRAM domain